MKIKSLVSTMIAISIGIASQANAAIDGYISVVNHSQYFALIGPSDHDAKADTPVPAGTTAENVPFADQIFVIRIADDGNIKDSFPFSYQVEPVGKDLLLQRQKTERGKTCLLTPVLGSIPCAKGFRYCYLNVTFNNDNTVDFYNGKTHHTAKLDSKCL